MRNVVLRLAMLAGAAVVLGGCTDSPTLPEQQRAADLAAPGLDVQTQGCVSDGYCVLPPISGGGCDPYEELDWSCDDDDGTCMTSAPEHGRPSEPGRPSGPTTQGCNDGGGTPPGGGSEPPPSEPPPPTEPTDTCNTGDPVVESDAIQTAFSDLWAQSNYDPNAPHSQRREQGGWITSDGAGGYSFEAFPSTWERTPCSIIFPSSVTPPSSLVAWVHTHPYTNGEVMTECEKLTLPGGLQRPFTYRGDPSYGDDELTQTLRQNGYPNVKGYIIDADKIIWFTGDDTATTVGSYPRCGY